MRTPAALLLGMVLVTGVAPQAEQTDQPPSWVSRRPSADAYFVGIGVAPREDDLGASRDRALKYALGDIAAQIETDVLSETRLEDVEDAESLEQRYHAEITTMVSGRLEGVEIVDTWEGRSNCWAYARLSRDAFHRLRQERIDRARLLALELYTEAEDQLAAGGTAAALSLYVQALVPLGQCLGDPLEATHRGDTLVLRAQVPLGIQTLVSSLRLEAAPVDSPLKQGANIDVPLQVVAHEEDAAGSRRAVAGLPVAYAFTRGSGDLEGRAWTAGDGVAASRLTAIRGPDRSQLVTARIDLESFLSETDDGVVAAGELRRFPAPSSVFHLECLPRTAYMASSESNLGRDLAVPHLEPLIRAALQHHGLVFAADTEQADLTVELDASTRQGQEFQGIYFAFLDLTVAVTDRRSGDEVFSSSLTGAKGAGPSHEDAGIKAYEAAAEEVRRSILPGLFAEIDR